MTKFEWRAVGSLSFVMCLRLIGLFMVLPLFSIYAGQISGSTPALIGLSIGVYGLTQALFQIPFGFLSDRYGRKNIIIAGLLIFAFGSFVCATSHHIYWLIIGRALQGAGAIGSVILATIADLTPVAQRTKSMAIAGISIGFSFSIAMFLGPLLAKWLSLSSLFLAASLCGMIAICITKWIVPTPSQSLNINAKPNLNTFLTVLFQKDLAQLNGGIFILHALFTASFIALPIHLMKLIDPHQLWKIYLSAILLALIVSGICIPLAEKKRQIKIYFLISIGLLIFAELNLYLATNYLTGTFIGVSAFLTGFTLLEAILPSLVSRLAPNAFRGTALGLYSCAQFSGIFAGGVLGGWIYSQFGLSAIYLFCAMLALLWLSFAYHLNSKPVIDREQYASSS